ncbi:chitinase [Acidicapsa ligni]|uniref:chitinase n=1 Tax=Acidicapsa ligni TaxID=542300 RepID=UPI0021DFF141|nr:chitinase [Acidicapsa ligni]
MRIKSLCLLVLLALSPLTFAAAHAQQGTNAGTVPTFQHTIGSSSYTLVGRDPAQGGTTAIPTVLVPITLSFEAKKTAGKPFAMDAASDVPGILSSPIFTRFAFTPGEKTQYADALLRTTFPRQGGWHTLLDKPEVKPLKITIPIGFGYVLTSQKSGQSLAVVDVQFLQKELFKQLPRQDGKLVIAVTHNTTYYSDGDATECCSWGTHGVDSATGNSFVLSSYLHAAPSVVEDSDIQPLTQQLAEFINDPLHDPLLEGGYRSPGAPGNIVPAWMRLAHVPAGDQGRCGGTHIASSYFLLEPTNTNPKNNIPASKGFLAHTATTTYHLQNVALLQWYTGASQDLGSTFSFPDANTLTEAAQPCPARGHRGGDDEEPAAPLPAVAASGLTSAGNGHKLIGYWSGYGRAGTAFPLREVSPQWDIILVAFATPDKDAPEGTMKFQTPAGLDPTQFKADIAYLKSKGKKVMISLGGGGQHFTLADPNRVPNYVSSVTQIVSEYGFDGIDIDFESPSLSIDPGDTNFQHPTTPSIVNLISALHQLHDHFGPSFMISLVPEGTQIPSGYPSYGGQFGSYLAITYAIRDILSFIDVQDYNTPPLQGLDGEIYQPGTVNYHAAMTELLLHGFNVGGDPKHFFPPLPPSQVAVGFLTPDTTPTIVNQAMDYIITGKAPAGTTYKLRNPHGYPGMIGAMFWTIDDDRRNNYEYSNTVGPQLHNYPAAK